MVIEKVLTFANLDINWAMLAVVFEVFKHHFRLSDLVFLRNS